MTQKELALLITDLWTITASMSTSVSASVEIDGVEIVPVRPEWMNHAVSSLQQAASSLETLLDDETEVERPPPSPILALVPDPEEG